MILPKPNTKKHHLHLNLKQQISVTSATFRISLTGLSALLRKAIVIIYSRGVLQPSGVRRSGGQEVWEWSACLLQAKHRVERRSQSQDWRWPTPLTALAPPGAAAVLDYVLASHQSRVYDFRRPWERPRQSFGDCPTTTGRLGWCFSEAPGRKPRVQGSNLFVPSS